MLDSYKKRLQSYGSYDGEVRNNHAQKIMEVSFLRDAATRPVYVKWVNSGLPTITDDDEIVYAKFNAKSYYTVTGDDVAYLLQFQNNDVKTNENIRVGSYVYIPNELGEMEWWLIVHFDDRPLFRQFSILKCTWTYRWVSQVDGKRVIHECLGVPRKQNSYNSGVWQDDTFKTVENQDIAFMPTNEDTKTIIYDTKFLKSSPGRFPPIVWKVSKIEDAIPDGLSRFTMTQEMFDPEKDNAELMIADYYSSAVTPQYDSTIQKSLQIVYSGQCGVRAGGGYKKFTAKSRVDGELIDINGNVTWNVIVPDGNQDKISYIADGNVLKVKCLSYYNLIGSTFTISASCNELADTLEVEVISL